MNINNSFGDVRRTRQRRALRAVFEQADRPLTPQEAWELARRSAPRLGIATVYRAVGRWAEAGWLHPVRLPGEPTRYERADLAHHHHFRCDRCERVYDVPGCPSGVDRILPPGFCARDHHITFLGICAHCQGAVRQRRRSVGQVGRPGSASAKRTSPSENARLIDQKTGRAPRRRRARRSPREGREAPD